MFEGQYLISNGGEDSVFGPWFARQGDVCTFTIETIQDGGMPLSVKILTKNSEDVGDGTATGSSVVAPASGSASVTASNSLKELVRYEFTWTSTTKGNFKLFRMLSPVWRDSV